MVDVHVGDEGVAEPGEGLLVVVEITMGDRRRLPEQVRPGAPRVAGAVAAGRQGDGGAGGAVAGAGRVHAGGAESAPAAWRNVVLRAAGRPLRAPGLGRVRGPKMGTAMASHIDV